MIRWTPLILVSPKRFVDYSDFWDDFDFRKWNAVYRWEEDPWGGVFDHAQEPLRTVTAAKGDCEDYALVAASWAVAQDREVSLAVCLDGRLPRPQHAVAYDETNVYSSGDIHVDTSIEEYVEESEYDRYISRRVPRRNVRWPWSRWV